MPNDHAKPVHDANKLCAVVLEHPSLIRSVLSWLHLRLALSCCIADPLRGRLLRPPRQACFADAQNATFELKTL